VYLGRFDDFEEISVIFQNETIDRGFAEDVTIPVACLKSAGTEQPELSLTGEYVDLKVVFSLTPVVLPTAVPVMEEIGSGNGRFVPSARAYKAIRSSVIAVANTPILLNQSAQRLTGTVRYAVDGGYFVLKTGYDLSKEFLQHVDLLFSEASQGADSRLEGIATSLEALHRRLSLALVHVDQAAAAQIGAVLHRLRPYISGLARLAYPAVSTALALTAPLRRGLYPYMQPLLSTALAVHRGLEGSPFVGPIVATATNRAMVVAQETADVYYHAQLEHEIREQQQQIHGEERPSSQGPLVSTSNCQLQT
jgi:hypothetical protein